MGKFGPKKSKLFVLTENWHIWYNGSADFESGLRFLKFQPQNPFLGKFGHETQSYLLFLKIGAHSISGMLIPNPDLDFWISDPKIHFWAHLRPKSQRYSFCLKTGTHGISRMKILIPTLVFWISNFKFLLGQIWTKKVKVVHFTWKFAHFVSWGRGFLFQD